MKQFRWLNAIFWGNSVALSWLWGLGLFFSVQITFLYGLTGLLCFAVPNAIGLFLFGFYTEKIARRDVGEDSLLRFFKKWSRPFRLVFYLYQILAITLTVFAVIRYLFEPLILPVREDGLMIYLLFLTLTVLVVLSAACLFGEEFNIRSIKLGHMAQLAILVVVIGVVLVGLQPFHFGAQPALSLSPLGQFRFWGYLIPIFVGFLVGPWLDLQQWQRAIQIHKESTSVAASYFWGSVQFFLLLIFHGVLALFVMRNYQDSYHLDLVANMPYAHDIIVQFMHNRWESVSYVVAIAYYTFIAVCILTTLDSGYVALKWFLSDSVNASQNPIFSFVPQGIISSPIPSYVFAGIFTIAACFVRLQLEYYMVFYASFFVGYSGLAIARCFVPNSQHPIPQIKMFSMGCLAVVLFSYGYFFDQPALMILAALLPIVYVLWLVFNTDLLRVVTEKAEEVIDAAAEIPGLKAISRVTHMVSGGVPVEVTTGSHFEDKWFVHSFVSTYFDTNSVGNVYFGMYGIWVGKARELFFNYVLPGFDLKTTPYFILTRSFEHKYVRETREFERISVKIRVADYNRKIVTLEHQVFDSAHNLLGKGQQQLIFVSSKDSRLIDLPEEVLKAFLPYVPGVKAPSAGA